MAPKKSFPRNGNPGRFAKTIIRKSGCATMTEGEACQFDAAKSTHKHIVCHIYSIIHQHMHAGSETSYFTAYTMVHKTQQLTFDYII